MFNDFNFLNYWKTNHKIKKTRELINRIYGHYLFKLDKVNTIENSLNRLGNLINRLEEVITELLPDLTIISIIPTEYFNYIDFKITVKNIGTADVATSVTNILMNSIGTNINIPALIIDETFEFNIQFIFDPLGEDKDYTIIAIADSDNSIEELNETNNDKSLAFAAKDVYVGTNIIVHCHNPEGKEINSITGVDNQVEIFVDSISKGYGTYNEESHGIPIEINPGNRLIEVKFNGITESQNINILEGNTQQLFFRFNRTEYPAESEMRAYAPNPGDTSYWSINMPIQTFDNWIYQSIFSQFISLGTTLDIWYGEGSLDYIQVAFGFSDIGYRIRVFLASRSYIQMRCHMGDAPWALKISSIPYDMDGSAV